MIRWNARRSGHLFLMISIYVLLFASNAFSDSAVQTIEAYFDLLASGNIESASGLWAETSRERAERFGISYEGIDLKLDCSSPIVRDLEVMKYYLYPAVKARHTYGNDYIRLEYNSVVNGNKIQHYYYVHSDGQYYWLIYPQDMFCRDWPVKESKYFRVHYHPSLESYLNETVLDEADRSIEALSDSLGISGSKLKLIEQKKIEYFYCDSDETVKQITGFLVKGTYDLPSNDIISAFFPHNHELAHFLINYKLKALPLYTLPLLREGLAVDLAGRWGKSPATLTELAVYLFKHEIVSIDSILTMSDFENQAGSDIVYPAAGLFVDFLRDKIGTKRIMDLYLRLSGPFAKLNGMSSDDVRKVIIDATESANWEKLMFDFDEYNAARLRDKEVVKPGSIKKGKSIIEGKFVEVSENKKWISFEFLGAPGSKLKGNFLFGHDDRLSEGASSLFEEQYGEEIPFEGYRYGVRYDENEVGLYDYATNHMIAKYIWGISPSEDYFNEKDNSIKVRFKKTLLNRMFSREENFKLLPR